MRPGDLPAAGTCPSHLYGRRGHSLKPPTGSGSTSVPSLCQHQGHHQIPTLGTGVWGHRTGLSCATTSCPVLSPQAPAPRPISVPPFHPQEDLGAVETPRAGRHSQQ